MLAALLIALPLALAAAMSIWQACRREQEREAEWAAKGVLLPERKKDKIL